METWKYKSQPPKNLWLSCYLHREENLKIVNQYVSSSTVTSALRGNCRLQRITASQLCVSIRVSIPLDSVGNECAVLTSHKGPQAKWIGWYDWLIRENGAIRLCLVNGESVLRKSWWSLTSVPQRRPSLLGRHPATSSVARPIRSFAGRARSERIRVCLSQHDFSSKLLFWF